MTSTLGFALLGLLARGPLSGYDIASQLKRGVGPFWSARHSQIYPELARLEAEGLVSYVRVEQQDRPDKKVYSLAPAGRQALQAWLMSPFPGQPIRDELTLRAYAIWLADPPRAAAVFREQERLHRAQLTEYEAIRQTMEDTWAEQLTRPDTPEFASYATLRRGLGFERELAEWCGWLADTLEVAAQRPSDQALAGAPADNAEQPRPDRLAIDR
jgi:DNA-binding PadR family transcriptional regulator